MTDKWQRDRVIPRKVVVKMALSPGVDERLVGLVGWASRPGRKINWLVDLVGLVGWRL